MENTKLTERELDLVEAAHNFGVRSFTNSRVVGPAQRISIVHHAKIVTAQTEQFNTREALRNLFENRAFVLEQVNSGFEALVKSEEEAN